MTLREYIPFWQETYDKHQSRPTTYAAHNYVFKNHILPGLGDIPLSELTSEMVGEFLEERRRFGNHRPGSSGLGEETMRHIHRLLQQCLDQAMRDGLIGDNPARAFHYSKPKKVNADVLTPLEMEDYLDAAERLGTLAPPTPEFVAHPRAVPKLVATAASIAKPNSMTWDIADPYRRGEKAARECADQLDDALARVLPLLAGGR